MKVSIFKSNNFYYAFIVFMISALTFRALYFMHGDWQDLSDAALGITQGRPHWRAFQNRLLGPYLVLGLDFIFLSYRKSLLLFTAFSILINNFLLYFLLKLLTINNFKSVIFVCAWSFLFLLFQDYWIYTWDMIDIILFTLIYYIILFSENKISMLLLYPLALANREMALFIPVIYIAYLCLNFIYNKNNIESNLILKLIGAFLLIIFGIIYVKTTRDFLFIERSFGGADEINISIGNHIHLFSNLEKLIIIGSFSASSFCIISVLVSTVVLSHLFFYTKIISIKLSIILFNLIIINIIIFGIVSEARMYLPLISLVIFIYVARQRELNGGIYSTV